MTVVTPVVVTLGIPIIVMILCIMLLQHPVASLIIANIISASDKVVSADGEGQESLVDFHGGIGRILSND